VFHSGKAVAKLTATMVCDKLTKYDWPNERIFGALDIFKHEFILF